MAKPIQPGAPLYIGATVYKGQLISKCPFGVTLSTKIAMKLLSVFLPYYIGLTVLKMDINPKCNAPEKVL